MFTIVDWRTADARAIDAALAAEAARWRTELAWDVSEAWRSIQPARVAGSLPGFVAIDRAGGIAGWTCFMLHHGTLQVAVLASRAPDVTRALVDAIFRSPDAGRADAYSVCVPDAAPLLQQSLLARGFDVVTYRYMESVSGFRLRAAGDERQTSDVGVRTPDHERRTSISVSSRPFHPSDLPAIVRLFSRAYPRPDEVRAFAPNGAEEEWFDYASSLVFGPGCGRIVAEASRVCEGSLHDWIDAAVVATDLGCGTGHIAQVAVDPRRQRRGLGLALVAEAMSVFAGRGFDRVTLLVSAANVRAQRLYAGLGFEPRASFLVALNRRPRRAALTPTASAMGSGLELGHRNGGAFSSVTTLLQ